MDISAILDLIKQLATFFGGFKDVFNGINAIGTTGGKWLGFTTTAPKK